MTLTQQLDAQIAAARAAGLIPTTLILSYADHWRLSWHDLGGPGAGYERAGVYSTFAPSYRGLPIICPGLAYDAPPAVGVRA